MLPDVYGILFGIELDVHCFFVATISAEVKGGS